jgi:membrane protein DedA with SNARE-associated domain
MNKYLKGALIGASTTIVIWIVCGCLFGEDSITLWKTHLKGTYFEIAIVAFLIIVVVVFMIARGSKKK